MTHRRIEVQWRLGVSGPREATLVSVDGCTDHDVSTRTCRGWEDVDHDVATDGCDCADCRREWDALEARYGEEWWMHPAWTRPQPYPVLLWWSERGVAVAEALAGVAS